MKKLKTALLLFWTMFKIGLFTFGGGYAMIAILERELVERKKWLEHDEFIDLIAIAESTPGPIAINSSTYIGYKRCGVIGSVFATLGVAMPSFIIIFLISLFYDAFIKIQAVNYAFKGIQACVCFLILSAGIKMLKKIKKTAFNIILFSLTILGIVAFTLFFPQLSFSSIYYILAGGVVGVITYLITSFRKKEQEKNEKKGDE
ncbi:MAG: chromate transporter [Clostridiales bacterium]|nr:chromate transporter [Clostridiales bacterium]